MSRTVPSPPQPPGSPPARAPGAGARPSVLRLAGTVLVVLAICLSFWRLGLWQYHKHERKDAQVAQLRADARRDPAPIDEVLAPGRSVDKALRYTRVVVRGTYDASAQTLIRYRPLDGQYGFHVLVPLITADGRALLVDRGFVPSEQTGRRPPQVEPPPAGQVEVVARLKPSETGHGTGADAGTATIRYVDVSALGKGLSYQLYGGWGEAVTERPQPTDPPQRIPEPELSTGSYVNLAYAYQWWLFIGIGLVGIFYYRRTNRRRDDEPAVGAPAREVPDADTPTRANGE